MFVVSLAPLERHLHSGKYKMVMESTLLFAYSAKSFGELIVHFQTFNP